MEDKLTVSLEAISEAKIKKELLRPILRENGCLYGFEGKMEVKSVQYHY
jgi:hypothetical protein